MPLETGYWQLVVSGEICALNIEAVAGTVVTGSIYFNTPATLQGGFLFAATTCINAVLYIFGKLD